MLKKIADELGFFIIKLVIALAILPVLLYWFDFRSSNEAMNKVEQLFLIEICVLVLFCSLFVLYILRFLLSLLFKQNKEKTEGKKQP